MVVVDPTRPSPLSQAVRTGNVAEVSYLLRTRADPNSLDETGETPLFEAAVVGSFEKVAALLLGGCDARHRSEVDGACAADLAPDEALARVLRAFAGSEDDAKAFRLEPELAEAFEKPTYANLLQHLGDLLDGKVPYGSPLGGHKKPEPSNVTSGSPFGGPFKAEPPKATSPAEPAKRQDPTPAPSMLTMQSDLRPEDDDFDWGRALWNDAVERASFSGAAGMSLSSSSGRQRLLAAGESMHLVLGEQPQCVEQGVRWVRVVVAGDEASGEWWARWGDLELVPAGVVSAAHEEARMDELMLRAERRGGQQSDEDYQRAWWHRMGVDMGGGFGGVQDWTLKTYVSRVRSVVGVREVRGSRNPRARTGARGPPCPPSALPPHFRVGDWSGCPTARAVSPYAVRGRVSIVCPTCEARQRFHELLYRNFCAQEWPDKELIVLDTGGGRSPFFAALGDDRVLYVHARGYALTLGHKRNQLIQMASGELVAHFDDDNVYSPQYLPVMVQQLRESRAQLVRLDAAFSWEPATGRLLWHSSLAFRAETFVHLRGPLRAIAFAHEKCGEEGGLGAVCVIHDLDDSYGIFMHVEHGSNVSCCSKVGDAWLKGERTALTDIPNAHLREMMSQFRGMYLNTVGSI